MFGFHKVLGNLALKTLHLLHEALITCLKNGLLAGQNGLELLSLLVHLTVISVKLTFVSRKFVLYLSQLKVEFGPWRLL